MNHVFSLKAGIGAVTFATSAALLEFVPTAASAASHRAKVPTETTYAGFVLVNPPTSTSVSTTFKVPTITCTSTPSLVIPGAGIISGNTPVLAAGIGLDCAGGAPSYLPQANINGKNVTFTKRVLPGDKITVTLTNTSRTATGSIQDKTHKFTVKFTGLSGKASLTCSGLDGDHGSQTDNPVPAFGKVVFSATTIDGAAIGSSGAVRVNMATSGGVLQIKTGAPNATGTGFTSTFVSTG